MAMKLLVKTTSGKIIEQHADPDLTIYELKALLSEEDKTGVCIERQTLLFKGRVCLDESTLEELGVNDESIIIMIRKSKRQEADERKRQEESEEKKADETTAAPDPTAMGGMPSLMSQLTMGAGGAGGVDFNQQMQMMREQLMANPELMQSIMNNPMMKQMMSNPDLLSNMFSNNPAFKKLLEDNPELRSVLKDPSLMQHAMRAATNPDYYNEMLRSNDRALQNIESLPGGFSALSRMYSQIQQPMEQAMDDMYKKRHGESRTVIKEVDKKEGVKKDAMPNPFSADYKREKEEAKHKKRHEEHMRRLGISPSALFSAPPAAPPGATAFNPYETYPWRSMMPPQMPSVPVIPGRSATSTTPITQPPEVRFQAQIAQLESMGFTDRQLIIEALVASNGELAGAIDYIDRKSGETTD